MPIFSRLLHPIHRLYSCIRKEVGPLSKSVKTVATCLNDFLSRFPSFWIQLFYFLFISTIGLIVLGALKTRTEPSFKPSNIDMFFTSVSAATVSSMSTVEIEVFSNTQLVILTILMFIGGEIFTSSIELQLRKYKLKRLWKGEEIIASIESLSSNPDQDTINNIEMGSSVKPEFVESNDCEFLKYCSIEFLGYVVIAYFLGALILGVAFVSSYLALIPSATNVLRQKGLKTFTFCVFIVVSTFASCGFVPTNENMVVFKKNSGLLIILIPQILIGNTLFPPCLRFLIWFIGKFFKKDESRYLLSNSEEIRFLHLIPGLHSSLLIMTVFGFIFVQFILFCAMDWNSEVLSGMSTYEKVIGVLFQSVSSRHTGETIMDISSISQAILVLFVIMMYLPPYTSYYPVKDVQRCEKKKKQQKGVVVENIVFSQLFYLVIAVIWVCITEREKLKNDPLNFNVLNIMVEVTSAYGNVGLSTGYSCKRQIHPDASCVDKTYGFAGKWSDHGKFVLIMVMFFGRLKKFNMGRHRPWKLL